MEQRELTKRLKSYTGVRIVNGEENIPMLYVSDVFISAVSYAQALSDEDLKAFIDETIETNKQ